MTTIYTPDVASAAPPSTEHSQHLASPVSIGARPLSLGKKAVVAAALLAAVAAGAGLGVTVFDYASSAPAVPAAVTSPVRQSVLPPSSPAGPAAPDLSQVASPSVSAPDVSQGADVSQGVYPSVSAPDPSQGVAPADSAPDPAEVDAPPAIAPGPIVIVDGGDGDHHHRPPTPTPPPAPTPTPTPTPPPKRPLPPCAIAECNTAPPSLLDPGNPTGGTTPTGGGSTNPTGPGSTNPIGGPGNNGSGNKPQPK
jgi:hypothetical protein